MVLSAIVVGQVVSVTPSYGKAKVAATRLLKLLERIPLLDSYSDDGKKPVRIYIHQRVSLLLQH